MFANEEITNYINLLSNNNLFVKLEDPEKEKEIFTSSELLKDHFPIDKISIRAIALQVLYSLEGEDEEYAKLKRHGITDYRVKDVSVSFDGSGISAEVIKMLTPTATAKVKRLI